MNNEEQAYLDLMRNVLEYGSERKDRTDVGTKSLFGAMLRFSLENDTLPVITTKKTFYRGAIEEMLFFIRGETDTKKLEAKGVNIWKANTRQDVINKLGLRVDYDIEEGDMGRMYGYQWRSFGELNAFYTGVDQLEAVFQSLKHDPYSRRHVVSAWNPSPMQQGVLAPCHYAFQFYVDNGMLSCLWSQRSVDCLLGLPFNIIGYSLLTHLMAGALGLKAKEVIFSGGDVHVYNNHVEQVKEQLAREPYAFPKIKINKELRSLQDIEATKFEDLEIVGYEHHLAIKGEMAV